MTEQPERFLLVHRIASYSLVNYFSDTVKDYYAYAKECNSLVKMSLETAESLSLPIIAKLDECSQLPIINNIISSVDSISCKQLDKIENSAYAIKDTTVSTAEMVADKIHGTMVESLIIKSVDVVDNIVDSLLPPKDDEEPEALVDPNVIERATPVIKKLTTRVSKDSLINLPAQTCYEVKDLVFRNAETIPQVQLCIGLLINASHKVKEVRESTQQAAKHGFQKGSQLSKTSADHVYQSLQHLMTVMTSLVAGISKITVEDARIALSDVFTLIQESKEKIHKSNQSFREDISIILQRTGELLSQQVAAGYNKVAQSDYASVRRAAGSLEQIINRLLGKFQPTESVGRLEQ